MDISKVLSSFLLLITICSIARAAPSISHYNLINTNTGKVVRRLRDGDNLKVWYPFTVEAVPSKKPRVRVMFTLPTFHAVLSAPFVYETQRSPRFRALTMLPSRLRLSAFTDFNFRENLTISVTLTPTSRPKTVVGPLPLRISGMNSSAASQSPCPTVHSISVEPPFDYIPHEIRFLFKHCDNSNRTRVRLMSYGHPWFTFGKRTVEKTFQMTSNVLTDDSRPFSIRPNRSRCAMRTAYLEACALPISSSSSRCTTSEFFNLPTEPVPDPLPDYRPPYFVELAPGDRLKLSFGAANNSNLMYGFSSDGYSSFQASLQTVLELPYGRRVFRSSFQPVVTNSSELHIPPRRWKNGVPGSFNGALFYALYSQPFGRCGNRNIGSFKGRYETRLSVRKSNPSLVKQDTALPEFDTPEYPPTVFGTSVTMAVKGVRNPGGGKLQGGKDTTLHYQWLVRTQENFDSRTYAEPITGATGPQITLKEAQCNKQCWSRWGVSGYHIYYIDVCNTYGCRRSDPIIPNILPPQLKPGEEWDPDYCSIEGTGFSCSGGQSYCEINGVVDLCLQ